MGDNDRSYSGPGESSNANLRRRINRPAEGDEEGVVYKECRRNVSIPAGRYTVDGCTEFLKAEDGRENDMLCVACGCHRSFHRKVIPAATRLRHAAAHYLFFNDVRNFFRPVAQPRPQGQPRPPMPQAQPRPPVPQLQLPQPPRPLIPQPAEMPRQQVAENYESEEEEEEEEDEEEEEEDESELVLSEIDTASDVESEVNKGSTSGEKNSKKD